MLPACPNSPPHHLNLARPHPGHRPHRPHPLRARCTAIGGYISCFAGFPAGTLAQIDPNLIHYRELTISGSANATLEDYAAAVATLSTGALDLSPLITHEFPLTQVDAALDAVRSRVGLKVAVSPGRGKPTKC